jgi:PAS domain S-box-containing protein
MDNIKTSLNRVIDNKAADAMAVQHFEIRDNDGNYIERSWSLFNLPVFDTNDNILYIIHKAEDVTHLIEERELHLKQQRLFNDLKKQTKSLHLDNQSQHKHYNTGESAKTQAGAFEIVFNSLPNAVIGIDESGIIKLFNEKASILFNYESEEIIDRPINEIIHCSVYNLPANLIEIILDKDDASNTKKLDYNCFGIRNGGAEFPFELTISQTQFDNALLYLLSVKDISVEKAEQAQQKDYIKSLEEKNQELEQFTYIASHDLQEPLRSITSFIELFQKEYHGVFDENAQTYFDFVLQSTGRMKELIKGLLDYSRIGKQMIIRKEDCKEILRQVIHDLNNSIERSKATVTIDPMPSLYASGLHLRILFQNLIANSLKFNKPGVPPKIHISVEQDKTHWLFCIKDNGIGMDVKYQDKIFTIFHRLHTKDTYEGTGIGLAHCKKIAQLHNGKIWFESELDKGTEFYFTISKNI